MIDCQSDTITLQRGSDLELTGVIEDEEGYPIDLTGRTVPLRQHAALGAVVTVTDAAAGEISITAQYADAWPAGRIMHFRLTDTIDGKDTSYPQVWVQIE